MEVLREKLIYEMKKQIHQQMEAKRAAAAVAGYRVN